MTNITSQQLVADAKERLDTYYKNHSLREMVKLSGKTITYSWLTKFHEGQITNPKVNSLDTLREALKNAGY